MNDDPNTGAGGTEFATEVVTIDATALTITNPTNEVATLTAAGTCRYTTPEGGGVIVTGAGVLIAQVDAAPHRGALIIPEQTLAVADLAGDWNTLSLDRTVDGGPIHLTSSTASFSAAGKLTAITFCDDVVTCVVRNPGDVALPNVSLKARADGGFDFTNATDGNTDRLYAYRAGGGEIMAVILSPAGHLSLATRKVARAMPAVGDVNEGWQIGFVPRAAAPFYTAPFQMSHFKSTVATLDAANAKFDRTSVTDFTNNVTRTETVVLNVPRDGYAHRLPATVTASNGAASNVSEWIALTMRGMGFSAVGVLGNNQLFLSASQAE